MIGDQYCEPCKKLFCEQSLLFNVDFDHHPDAKSFEAALCLPCSVCSCAWGEEDSSLFWQENTLYGTTGRLWGGNYSIPLTLYFSYGPHRSKDIALVPWEDMINQKLSMSVSAPISSNVSTKRDPRSVSSLPNLLSHNTRSTSSLDFLRSKYRECRDEHTGCTLQQSTGLTYPSRVIDVGETEDSPIYLCDTQGVNHRESYACLSHCWGQKQPFKLTKQTKSMLQDGLPVSALPATFQDAVLVTRLVGIRFLWIDSLCIFQDSKVDWSIEASRMGDIYSGAEFTIAATRAKSSDGGLFVQRSPVNLQPLRIEATWTLEAAESYPELSHPLAGIYWCDLKELWTQAIELAPLNQRAWVCQERHLSRRTMHFSATQLFWECHKVRACENYPNGLPWWALPNWFDDFSVLRNDIHQLRLQNADISLQRREARGDTPLSGTGPLLDHQLYFSWATFRIRYTECAMTKDEDKLVAIQGIAQQLSYALSDQFVAGLWYNRLLEELCWFKSWLLHDPPPSKLTKWRAPTWSWASSNTRIWVSNTTKFHRGCRNKQIWGEVDTVDVKANTSGDLEYASLRIRCKLIRAVIESQIGGYERTGYALYGTLTLQKSLTNIQATRSGDAELNIEWDDFEWEETCHVYMMVLQRCLHHQDRGHSLRGDCVEGLLLVPQDGCNDVFKRVGLFTAKGNQTVAKVLTEHDAAESKIVTLI